MTTTTPTTPPARHDAGPGSPDAVRMLYAVELFIALAIIIGLLIARAAPEMPDSAALYMEVI